MTSSIQDYPTRISVIFEQRSGSIVLDQIRTIDKSRVINKLGTLDNKTALLVLETLGKIFS
jgi:mRNA interferase MazF